MVQATRKRTATAGLASAAGLAAVIFALTSRPVVHPPDLSGDILQNGTFSEGVNFPSFWWTNDLLGGAVFSWDRDKIFIENSNRDNLVSWAQTIAHPGLAGARVFIAADVDIQEIVDLGPSNPGIAIVINCFEGTRYLGGLDTARVLAVGMHRLDGTFDLFPETNVITFSFDLRGIVGTAAFDNASLVV